MISPEILRRYPVFVGFDDTQLKSLAMIADETVIPADTLIFEEAGPADRLFLLVTGNIDFYIKSEEEYKPDSRRDYAVGEINPGELFGISTFLDQDKYNVTARCSVPCRVIEFDGAALRKMSQDDIHFAYLLMHQIAKSLADRLYATRVQLAAAWA